MLSLVENTLFLYHSCNASTGVNACNLSLVEIKLKGGNEKLVM